MIILENKHPHPHNTATTTCFATKLVLITRPDFAKFLRSPVKAKQWNTMQNRKDRFQSVCCKLLAFPQEWWQLTMGGVPPVKTVNMLIRSCWDSFTVLPPLRTAVIKYQYSQNNKYSSFRHCGMVTLLWL